MGLDMYFTKRVYVKNWDHREPEELHQITIKRGGKLVPKTEIDTDKIKEVVQDAGYWRKANAIHRWFVDNVQEGEDDCKDYYVSQEQMKELLDLVNRVRANHALAGELLPTQSGFFYGGTEYDQYYFESLEHSKQTLEEALDDKAGDYYYASSW